MYKYIAPFVIGLATGTATYVVYKNIYEPYSKKIILSKFNITSPNNDEIIYINTGQYEDAYHALTEMDDDEPINIIIQGKFGSRPWGMELASQIKNRKGCTRMFVDGPAYDIATIIALSADELYFREGSVLSTIEPYNNKHKSEKNYFYGYKEVINDKYDSDKIIEELYYKETYSLIEYGKDELAELGVIVN
jgi:hypothetical protein